MFVKRRNPLYDDHRQHIQVFFLTITLTTTVATALHVIVNQEGNSSEDMIRLYDTLEHKRSFRHHIVDNRKFVETNMPYEEAKDHADYDVKFDTMERIMALGNNWPNLRHHNVEPRTLEGPDEGSRRTEEPNVTPYMRNNTTMIAGNRRSDDKATNNSAKRKRTDRNGKKGEKETSERTTTGRKKQSTKSPDSDERIAQPSPEPTQQSTHDDWVEAHGVHKRDTSAEESWIINDEYNSKLNNIKVWNDDERKFNTYYVLHTFWNTQQPNSYVVMEPDNAPQPHDKQKPYPAPVVKPTLRLFYTIDIRSLSYLNVRVLGVLLNKTRPLGKQLQLNSVNQILSTYDYVFIIRQTIIDAFDTWNRMLDNTVHFEYIPYSDKIRTSRYVNKIIIVSATNVTHINEHTTEFEEFSSQATLAHASINFLHLNSESSLYIIAPHIQRHYVQILREVAPKIYKVFSVSKANALEYMNIDSLETMNGELQSLTRQATENVYKLESCFYCTILHEVGHILGIGHSSTENSIMYEVIVDNEQLITGTDVKAVKKLFSSLRRKEEILEYQMIRSNCPIAKPTARPRRRM